MSYDDVPLRLASGELVPRAEIIGYYGADSDIRITLALETLRVATIMTKDFSDGTAKYGLTELGMSIRLSLITRLEGDCPECP